MSVAAPAGTEWSGEMLGRKDTRQTPDQVANTMLAEKRDLNARTRLSWDPNKVPIRGEGKFVGGTTNEKTGEHEGGVCLSLPYVNVERRYYVQNCRIFKLNGDEVTLKQVFDLENGSALYLRVEEVLKNHQDLALAHDPALCRHCLKFRAAELDEMMQHTIDEHPDVIAKMAGVKVEAESPKTEAKDTVSPWCESCDRTFKNAGGLRLHRIKVHDKAA